jgi:hypothetical protein
MATLRSASIEPEVLALIAAAVAAILGQTTDVDVQKIRASVAWVNAWAIEGLFQHYLAQGR